MTTQGGGGGRGGGRVTGPGRASPRPESKRGAARRGSTDPRVRRENQQIDRPDEAEARNGVTTADLERPKKLRNPASRAFPECHSGPVFSPTAPTPSTPAHRNTMIRQQDTDA